MFVKWPVFGVEIACHGALSPGVVTARFFVWRVSPPCGREETFVWCLNGADPSRLAVAASLSRLGTFLAFFSPHVFVSRMTPCYFATREDTADDIIAVLFLRARSSCLFESEGTS